jgi:hypothetical protein
MLPASLWRDNAPIRIIADIGEADAIFTDADERTGNETGPTVTAPPVRLRRDGDDRKPYPVARQRAMRKIRSDADGARTRNHRIDSPVL